MKTTLLIILIAAACFSLVHAEPKPGISIVPSHFHEKTFEECEKILGKPTSVEDPKPNAEFMARSYIRTYASPIPGIAKIQLSRAPVGGEDGPVGLKVNVVKYYFPKGRPWRECVALIGLNPDDMPFYVEPAGKPRYTQFGRDKENHNVVWVPSEASLKNPPAMQNPDYDTLKF